MRDRFQVVVAWCVLASSLLAGGCRSTGPGSVHRDRLDYGTAMSETLKQQTILNIVKSRYLDWPTFLDVNQIVAGYSLSGTASLTWTWYPDASASDNTATGVSGTFTESPTITYAPLAGKDFASSLLEPLDPPAVLAVAYSGWKVDRLLELTLNSINGRRNAMFTGDSLNDADPDFYRALDLFQRLQAADAWGLRRASSGSGGQQEAAVELFFRPAATAPEVQDDVAALKEALGLDPEADSYRVRYGTEAGDPGAITFGSRTLWEVFWELQRYVQVPAEDETAGRVSRLPPPSSREPILRIHSGADPPARAFTAVRYRGTWFWVDDADLGSKHSVSIVLMMMTLARTESVEAPQLVIPTR